MVTPSGPGPRSPLGSGRSVGLLAVGDGTAVDAGGAELDPGGAAVEPRGVEVGVVNGSARSTAPVVQPATSPVRASASTIARTPGRRAVVALIEPLSPAGRPKRPGRRTTEVDHTKERDRPQPAPALEGVWSTTPVTSGPGSGASHDRAGTGTEVAYDLVGIAEEAAGTRLPIRVRAWDGSEAGAPAGPDVPLVLIRSRRALRHLIWRPGELGLARAYVTGELDLEGDLTDGLRRVWRAVRERPAAPTQSRRDQLLARARAVRTVARLGAIGPRPPRPASESRLTGRLHTTFRDRAAISHHYDLSNAFYQLLLDPQMAYSCAYWPADDPTYPLEAAQRDKLDLVCRKLALTEGSRLLDVGCGWGSLALHAAQHYGARVVGVTLSVEQRDFVRARAAERGVADRLDIRLQHYRDVPDSGFDAVSSIEMGEHVGRREYVDFAARLHGFLRPQGRLLVQQMSRNGTAPGGGPFIETYIAPDMHMKSLATTIGLLEDAGLEIREVQAMREHYPRTVRAWLATLEARWDDAVAIVGVEVARVWRLYLAGGALAFEENRMGVDQILAVRPDADGGSGLPWTPRSWRVEPGTGPA